MSEEKSEKESAEWQLAGLCALPVMWMWSGLVFCKLWQWFVISAFNAPKIGIAEAIGISLTIRFLSGRASSNAKWSEIIIASIVYPAIVLLAGWIVKQFLP